MESPRKGDTHARLMLRFLARRLRKIGPVFLAVFVGTALALYWLESGAPDGKFASIKDAFWFCVVTMSTVGYGDVFPVTGLGRILTGGFILFTLGTVGLLITAVSEAIMEVKRMKRAASSARAWKATSSSAASTRWRAPRSSSCLAADRKVALLCEKQRSCDGARTSSRKTPTCSSPRRADAGHLPRSHERRLRRGVHHRHERRRQEPHRRASTSRW
jgi:hypothetical protein